MHTPILNSSQSHRGKEQTEEEPFHRTCPYCNAQMQWGCIKGCDGHATYWLPEQTQLRGFPVSSHKIRKANGFVLGEATKAGFIAKSFSVSFYCPNCAILLTELGASGNETE